MGVGVDFSSHRANIALLLVVGTQSMLDGVGTREAMGMGPIRTQQFCRVGQPDSSLC